jgi:hypothetical protein
VENCEIAFVERKDAPRVRLDVVDEDHVAQADVSLELGRIDIPWEVDPRHAPSDDHARDAESCAFRTLRRREDAEPRLGCADITGRITCAERRLNGGCAAVALDRFRSRA